MTGDVTLTCASGTPDRNSATAIVVDGGGHVLTQTCADHGVLEQSGVGQVTLTDVTITGGDSEGRGGAIVSEGGVVVTQSVLRDNHADAEGGAINARSGSTVDISDSTLSGNSADGSGGAIASQGLVTMHNSTLSGNTSDNQGGAVRSYGGLTVVNSTISGNTASNSGGAATANSITLVYATIVDNTARRGGSFNVQDGMLTSFGSVVAGPADIDNCRRVGSTTGTGYNVDDDGSCGFGSGPGDLSNFAGDLELGALTDNGGSAQTMLPAATSPLVDQIPVDACHPSEDVVTDQRGIDRPQGTACDIGAVEVEVASPPTTSTIPETTIPETTIPGTTIPEASTTDPASPAPPATPVPGTATYTG